MTRSLNQMECSIRPCSMQSVSVLDRTRHVVTAVHDCSWNTVEPISISKQLAVLHPAIHKQIMVFQSGKREREVAVAIGCRELLVGQERDRFTFPKCPCLGRLDLRSSVVACKSFPIGGNHVTSFVVRYRRLELLPLLWKYL